jgi:hypothetical protein
MTLQCGDHLHMPLLLTWCFLDVLAGKNKFICTHKKFFIFFQQVRLLWQVWLGCFTLIQIMFVVFGSGMFFSGRFITSVHIGNAACVS